MDQLQTVITAGAIAGGSTLVAAILGKPWSNDENRSGALVALLIGIGYLISFGILIDGDLQILPPKEGWRWIFWVGVIATWGGLGDCLIGKSTIGRMLHWIPLITFGFILLGLKRMKSAWSPEESVIWIASAVVATILLAIVSHLVNKKVSSRAVLIGWAMSIGVGSVFIVLLGRFQQLANLGTMLSIDATMLLVVAFIFGKYKPGFSVWMILSLLFSAVVIGSLEPWHAYLPISMGIPMLLAPLGCVAAIPFTKKPWWVSVGVVLIASTLILAWPGWNAYHEYMELRAEGFAP